MDMPYELSITKTRVDLRLKVAIIGKAKYNGDQFKIKKLGNYHRNHDWVCHEIYGFMVPKTRKRQRIVICEENTKNGRVTQLKMDL